jgi:hypothetical protein
VGHRLAEKLLPAEADPDALLERFEPGRFDRTGI